MGCQVAYAAVRWRGGGRGSSGEGVVGEGGAGVGLTGKRRRRLAGGAIGPGFDPVGGRGMFKIREGVGVEASRLVRTAYAVQTVGLGVGGYVGGRGR